MVYEMPLCEPSLKEGIQTLISVVYAIKAYNARTCGCRQRSRLQAVLKPVITEIIVDGGDAVNGERGSAGMV